MTYATTRLYEEVAYVAYHFHWDLDLKLTAANAPRKTPVAFSVKACQSPLHATSTGISDTCAELRPSPAVHLPFALW